MFFIPNNFVKKARERKKFSFNDLIAKELLIYTVLIGLFSCGNGLLTTYLALMGEERGIGNIALFFTAYSIMLVLVRPVSGKLMDKKGLAVILYPAYIIGAVGMALLARATNLWMVVVSGILKALGQGAGSPSIQAHCIKELGKERAGVAASTCFIGQDVGNAIAPIIGGVVVTQFGYGTLFYSYAIFLAGLGCGLFAFKTMRDKRKSLAKAEEAV